MLATSVLINLHLGIWHTLSSGRFTAYIPTSAAIGAWAVTQSPNAQETPGNPQVKATRSGRAVATVGPAAGPTGRDLKDVLKRNRPDAAWADELRELRDFIGSETDPLHA